MNRGLPIAIYALNILTFCYTLILIAITSPLTSNNLPEASVTAGSAAFVTEVRKLMIGSVQSWAGSQFHLWLRRMDAGVQRPSGLHHSLPPV